MSRAKKHNYKDPNEIPTHNRISHKLPDNIRDFIKQHYKTTPRSKLAKSLGIEKKAFNQICIEMGLGA